VSYYGNYALIVILETGSEGDGYWEKVPYKYRYLHTKTTSHYIPQKKNYEPLHPTEEFYIKDWPSEYMLV
jgi:hypothetical protein